MSESRLQKWALRAEVIGAAAVVLTFGYLAVEMRSNTNAIQAQTNQSMMEELNNFRRGLWNSEMAEVMIKFRRVGWEGLTDVEKELRWSVSASRWAIYESVYFAHQRGVLGRQEWGRFETAFCRGYLADRGIWQVAEFAPSAIASMLTPEFVEYVESSCG